MRLSVALAAYRGAAHLPAQLASLAAQTRPPDELVAVDDASPDDTRAVLERFAAPFPVRVIAHPTNRGTAAAFETAVAACTGDVILLCDQDDEWLPAKVERFAAAFADPAVGLAVGDAELVGPGLEPTGRTLWQRLPFPARDRRAFEADPVRRLLRSNVVTGACAGFRADLRRLVLPIPAGWEHDAWIGLVAAAVSAARVVPTPLVRYRQHAGQQTGTRGMGWAGRAAAASGRTPDEYRRLAAGFDQLADRLRDVAPGVAAAAQGKADHLRTRAAARGRPRAFRLPLVGRELLAGRYHRFGRGWAAGGADLLL